ncbi:hypothetical protein Jab_2c20070 [Janthinobacterium sp. HH01]|uniref:hypothetical protein n=1 Tax=Janthinobacterium sp. HH01 TaxID=1198452 RepID=UPI0002AEDBCC|nr:hypothetical protein [Janthinobacterium sp. HH01]ELX09923.1 hypothetical protein Jab_2c20070 [Janthinobacterium sp. HH01]
MSDTKPAPTLYMSFDADQIGGRLFWHTWPDDRAVTGTLAGTLALPANAPLSLVVSGGGAVASSANPEPFVGFDIKEFCVVSRPQIVARGPSHPVLQYAAPSPFAGHDTACRSFRWEGGSQDERTDDYLNVVKTLAKPLELGAAGSWALSILVTVAIYRKGPAQQAPIRVFAIDVEAELSAPAAR